MEVRAFSGLAARPYLEQLAKLRIRVFSAYPYLYDGDLAYEETYLRELGETRKSVLAVAFAKKEVVGVATGLPLAKAGADVRAPWEAKNEHLDDWYYFSESVLLPDYRGQGIGRRFMELRQRWAKEVGYKKITFCTVIRPKEDPKRPDDYRSLQEFWRKEGFEPLPDIICEMKWKELDSESELSHQLQFWGKSL